MVLKYAIPAAITRPLYDLMVEKYTETPGQPVIVHKAVIAAGFKCSYGFVQKAWSVGWPSTGWALPIETVLMNRGIDATPKRKSSKGMRRHEELAARIRISKDEPRTTVGRKKRVAIGPNRAIEEERARLAEAQKRVQAREEELERQASQLAPVAAAAERVVTDAVKEREREALVARNAVSSAMQQLGTLARIGPAMNQVADFVSRQIAARVATGQMPIAEGMNLLDRYALTAKRIGETATKGIQLMRLHLGEPGEIVQQLTSGPDQVTDQDVAFLVKELGGEQNLRQAVSDLGMGLSTPAAAKLLDLQWQRQDGVTGRSTTH